MVHGGHQAHRAGQRARVVKQRFLAPGLVRQQHEHHTDFFVAVASAVNFLQAELCGPVQGQRVVAGVCQGHQQAGAVLAVTFAETVGLHKDINGRCDRALGAQLFGGSARMQGHGFAHFRQRFNRCAKAARGHDLLLGRCQVFQV